MPTGYGNTFAENNNLPIDFFNYAALQEMRDPARENKPFMWPGSSTHSIFGGERKIVRGFMRSILTDVMPGAAIEGSPLKKKPGNYRLNFQFNPESITRDVAQSIGAVNPILQNPANLTQAVPGTATFNFTMTFNREMEVNNHNANIDYKKNGYDLANERDPGVIGVWADVKLFDTIIGQGITDELIDMVKTFSQQQDDDKLSVAQLQYEKDLANGKKDKDGNALVAPEGAFKSDDFDKAVALNIGNSAFLNPLPVRVVFSDTFMIEGLVTGAAVAFQKFSPNMTPTICQINVNFSALYLGFAKKDAFLTNNLANWAKDVQDKGEIDKVETTASQAKLQSAFTSWRVLPAGSLAKNKIVNAYTTPGSTHYPNIPRPNTSENQTWWKSDEYYHGGGGTEKYAGFSAFPAYVTLQQWWNLCNSKWAATPNTYTWTPYLGGLAQTAAVEFARSAETFQNIASNHKEMLPCVFGWDYKAKQDDLKDPDITLTCELTYSYKNEKSTGSCTIVDLKTVHNKENGYSTFWLKLPENIKATLINKSTYANTQIMMSESSCNLKWTLNASKSVTTSTGSTEIVTAKLELDCPYDKNGFFYMAPSLDGLKKKNSTGGGGAHPKN